MTQYCQKVENCAIIGKVSHDWSLFQNSLKRIFVVFSVHTALQILDLPPVNLRILRLPERKIHSKRLFLPLETDSKIHRGRCVLPALAPNKDSEA